MRPELTELRLSAYAGHRSAVHTLGPATLFTGPSGSGKSTALAACSALAALGAGATLEEVFPEPLDAVPENARPDSQGRRGFRIGCTADGPVGPVRLDLAVQAEPELRIVGERLSGEGITYLETALRDPGRPSVQAAWHTAGSTPVTRAPLPDDQLGTALLPLRVSGRTEGQRQVLAAAEQMVLALRSTFRCDPDPSAMRPPATPRGGRLLSGCDNLAEIVLRAAAECPHRYGLLEAAAREGCTGPVNALGAQRLEDGRVLAHLERAEGGTTPLSRLADGELRHLALSLVLLTGPGILDVDPVVEVPGALQTLTVFADGIDRGLDAHQSRHLLSLAAGMCARGHVRLLATASDAQWASAIDGITVVDLGRTRTGPDDPAGSGAAADTTPAFGSGLVPAPAPGPGSEHGSAPEPGSGGREATAVRPGSVEDPGPEARSGPEGRSSPEERTGSAEEGTGSAQAERPGPGRRDAGPGPGPERERVPAPRPSGDSESLGRRGGEGRSSGRPSRGMNSFGSAER